MRSAHARRLPLVVAPANHGTRALVLDNNSPGVVGVSAAVMAVLVQRGPTAMLYDMSIYGPGTVRVLDARSGRLLRTVPVGPRPTRLVVDDAAHRAFIVNDGGFVATRNADPWGWLPANLRRWLPFYRAPGTHLTRVASSVTVIDTRNL